MLTDKTKNNLRNEMKKQRIDRGFTQAQVAAKLSVNTNYYSQIESGYAIKPSEALLIEIANFYGFDTDEFLHLYGRLASDIYNGIMHNPIVISQLRERGIVHPKPQHVVSNVSNESEAHDYDY